MGRAVGLLPAFLRQDKIRLLKIAFLETTYLTVTNELNERRFRRLDFSRNDGLLLGKRRQFSFRVHKSG